MAFVGRRRADRVGTTKHFPGVRNVEDHILPGLELEIVFHEESGLRHGGVQGAVAFHHDVVNEEALLLLLGVVWLAENDITVRVAKTGESVDIRIETVRRQGADFPCRLLSKILAAFHHFGGAGAAGSSFAGEGDSAVGSVYDVIEPLVLLCFDGFVRMGKSDLGHVSHPPVSL